MNDSFMPEREAEEAYPFANAAVRAYFTDRGRLPTPEEEAVLDECLRADSRFNLLLTRYADVRIADAEAARCFEGFIKRRRPQNGYITLRDLSLLELEKPCAQIPRPGDLLLYIDDLPRYNEGAQKAGMNGYCFQDGDVARLRSFLEALNA